MVDFVIKYWIEVMFTCILGLFAFGYKKLEKRIQEQEAIRLGVQAMLRNMIVQAYNKAAKDGYCKIYELENVESMYVQYKELGGNGAVASLVERLREMPTMEKEPPNLPKKCCEKEEKCEMNDNT